MSTVILAYGGILGPISIVVYLGIWVSRLVWRGKKALARSRLLLAIPLWGLLSVLWSEFPAESLYRSAEYASLILCTLIMGNTVTPRSFVRGLIIGCSLTLLASLASGKYGVDPFSGNYSLVGLFGSKNMVGLFGEITILLCYVALYFEKSLIQKCMFSIGPVLLGLVCLFLSKSASSVLSLVAAFGFLFVITLLARLPRQFRILAFAYFAISLAGVAIAAYSFDLQGEILHAFGKSNTLTGRTVLWAVGMAQGMQSPLIGHGFGAFWVQGFPPAEALWYRFGISLRTGFHFHNLYIESLVEIGLVGVALFGMVLWGGLATSILRILYYGMKADYLLALGITLVFVLRSFVEVDLLGTYGVGPFMLFPVFPLLKPKQPDKEFVPLLRPLVPAWASGSTSPPEPGCQAVHSGIGPKTALDAPGKR